MRSQVISALLISLLGSLGNDFAQAAMAPPGSRKIIPTSIAGYTPATPTALTATAGSVAVSPQPPFDLSMLSSILSALSGGSPSESPSSFDNSSNWASAGLPYTPQNSFNPGPSSATANSATPSWSNDSAETPSLSGTGFSQVSCGKTQSTLITHYGADPAQYASAKEALMEGGSLDRHGKTLNSVEDSIRNGRPISLAGDQFGNFGQRCNKSPSQSCLMLVCYQNFDRVFSNYRARFPGVQKNCLIGVVVDTGDAFNGTSGRKIDVATEDIVKARTLSGPGRYFEIESAGCNSGSGDKRACLVNNLQASCVPGDRNVAGTRSLQKTAAVR